MSAFTLSDLQKMASSLPARKTIYYLATKAVENTNEDGDTVVYVVKQSLYHKRDIYLVHPDHLEKFLAGARLHGFEPIDQKEAWKREREAKTQEIAGRMNAEGE